MSENPNDYKSAKADARTAKAVAKANRPVWRKKRYWLLVAVVLIVLIAVVSASGGDSDGGDSGESDKAVTANGKSKPDVKTTAKEMIAEFDNNEASADAKYKDKVVQVTGVVDKIDTEIFDDSEYVARLGGGGQFEIWTVNCNDMSQDEVASLNKGDEVTIVGKFDDGGDLGVELSDCSAR